MTVENEFLNYLNSLRLSNEKANEAFLKKVKFCKVSKSKLLLTEGEICDRIWLVKSGLVHGYFSNYSKGDFQQTTEWFAEELDVFCSFSSFVGETPSQESIEVLEPSELYFITRSDLYQLYVDYPEINILGRIIIEKSLILNIDRLREMKSLSAQERLKNFYIHSKGLFLRVPQKYIASYLGISKNYVSRLKASH